ncbi:hypothetical protein BT96DRAFT_195487 [Gymnopus androsaceus JB14]|uniref:Hydrophobin n=1 Tax=Gymnopus androsaceus JB14 TaxID=1447944 RepID=A0A6A4H9C9_9AGAR|nr:hypothetical protein BT96DRAFT_195487 [Gymnopus androsaceus JB14]
MYFNRFMCLSLFATIGITVASPTTTCSDAYNGNTSNNRGPGVVYSCTSVTFVLFSDVCEGASPGSVVGRPAYCCSGNLIPASPGEPAAVGGCFPL